MAASLEIDSTTEIDPVTEFLVQEKYDLDGLHEELSDGLGIAGCTESSAPDDSNYESAPFDLEELDARFSLIDYESINEESEEMLEKRNYYSGIKSWFEEGVEKKLEESEKVRKWREENRKLLEEKDAREAREKEEMRLRAKLELEEWYRLYEESLKRKRCDDEEEPADLVQGDHSSDAAATWCRVAELCDLSQGSRSTKDTSRMREILLSLKSDPPRISQ